MDARVERLRTPADGPAAMAHSAACSRRRSLVRDLAGVLDVQMRYWGFDARGGDNSVLVRAGLRRLPRLGRHREGSSRYREPWQGGWIELHSYCAGFYHPSKPGILFSRADRRVSSALPGGIPEPGRHRLCRAAASPDEILSLLPPFLCWLLDYENRVETLVGRDYRERCWRALGEETTCPPPETTRAWLGALLRDPRGTPRLHPKNRDRRPRSKPAPRSGHHHPPHLPPPCKHP